MTVTQIINRALEKNASKKIRKQRNYFYISEAGRTPFELFKKLTKNSKITPRMQRIFDNGICVHNRIRDYLVRQGVVKGIEVKIKNKLLHGRADAIIFADGKIAVLEIKSMNKACFENLRKYCNRNAYLQTQLYMHFLKIDDGIIIVECKDSQRLKEFHIKRKPRIAKEQINYFSKLKKKFVKSGVMTA